MSLSCNEIEALAFKAARGAGLDWGIAEEVADAAGWLARQDLAWAPPLAALLQDWPHLGQPEHLASSIVPVAGPHGLCPLRAGLFLAELRPRPIAPVRLGRVAHPIWLLPFLARIALRERRPMLLQADAARVVVSQHAQRGGRELSGLAKADVLMTEVAASDEEVLGPETVGAGRRAVRIGRAPIPAEALSALERLEKGTYVPASAQSRLTGAGAGLADND